MKRSSRENREKNPVTSNCNERQSFKSDSVGKIEREEKRVCNVGKKQKGGETKKGREKKTAKLPRRSVSVHVLQLTESFR